MIKLALFNISICLVLLLYSCSGESKKGLTIAASSVPHAEMLEHIKPDLEQQGIHLTILVSDDYNMPNRALANGEIDANFFQHLPFLEEQQKQFNYPIDSFAKIEIEPMGIYSKKIKSLNELKAGSSVALPNDPTNEARALLLLQELGLISLDNSENLHVTVLNLKKNPKQLKFIEVDAAMLPRTLDDVDAAAINTNYALAAGLSPIQDALAIEGENSPYVNIIVIKIGDENRADLQALKTAMTSKKMRTFILEKYKGAIIPAFP